MDDLKSFLLSFSPVDLSKAPQADGFLEYKNPILRLFQTPPKGAFKEWDRYKRFQDKWPNKKSRDIFQTILTIREVARKCKTPNELRLVQETLAWNIQPHAGREINSYVFSTKPTCCRVNYLSWCAVATLFSLEDINDTGVYFVALNVAWACELDQRHQQKKFLELFNRLNL